MIQGPETERPANFITELKNKMFKGYFVEFLIQYGRGGGGHFSNIIYRNHNGETVLTNYAELEMQKVGRSYSNDKG